ncbi:MAG TPA: tetratricopeptide repeat-containing glycosyltransferase family protein, partial [Pirellulaceae bacterium]|nr:tetratricopeptide repeat-containing glycosyltransferase family protein [Pirellulaceae bacterium]
GLALKQRGDLEGAAASYNRALQLDPNYAEAHNNLGVVRRAQGDTASAIECYRRAIAAAPRHAEARNNLANALQAVGRFDEALTHYDQAIQIRPQYTDARCNRSLLVLLMGDFAKAWGDYECRSQRKESPPPRFPIEMWNGEPLNGKSILLHCEQGLGDTLQFVRYAQLIRDRGGEITLECPPALRAVLGTCPWIDRLIERGQPLPQFHTHAPLLSLPRILGTTVETIPAPCPYLHVAPALVEQWRNRLAAIPGLKGARLKVGLAWQGNPSNRYDAARSFRLADLAPLAGVPGVRFVSLQHGFGAEQLRQPHPLGDVVEFDDDFDRAAGAFMDTAAVMTQLDLVITADSALAHVAGALNVPAWVALAGNAVVAVSFL